MIAEGVKELEEGMKIDLLLIEGGKNGDLMDHLKGEEEMMRGVEVEGMKKEERTGAGGLMSKMKIEGVCKVEEKTEMLTEEMIDHRRRKGRKTREPEGVTGTGMRVREVTEVGEEEEVEEVSEGVEEVMKRETMMEEETREEGVEWEGDSKGIGGQTGMRDRGEYFQLLNLDLETLFFI